MEDVLALHPHRGEVVDVEEAPGEARLGIDVEHLAALGLVGPPAVLGRRAHVVRHDVEDDPEPRPRQGTERVLAAELA